MVRGFSLTRLVVIALWAFASAAPAVAGDGGRRNLVIGITQFPSTFNPLIDAMMAKSYILAMTRRPITAYDQRWKLVCLLCTRLPTIENGLAVPETLPNGKRGIAITVTLNPKATWGDGVPVTSRDVVFTWRVGRNPKTGIGDSEAFRRIRAIDVKDDKTVTLHVDRVTFDYNDLSGFDLLPAHLERAKFTDPVAYRNRTSFDTDTTNPGLYFGPYRIAKVVSGSYVVLVPNPTWYGKTPYFRRIVVRVIENTAALEANLRAGNIDYIAGELGLTIDQALALQKRDRGAFTFVYKSGLIYEHLDVNLDNPILKDLRVRRALILGLDRETISQQLFGDRQPVADSLVSPLDWMASKDVRRYRYDPKRAAALLDDAGWRRGRGGIRHNAEGAPLKLVLMTTAGNRSRELVEQVLQSQWRALGIDARIRNEPARVFFGQTLTRRKFPALAMFAWISAPESVPRTTLYSTMIPTKANNYSGQNFTGFRNAEMDRLIDSIEITLDRDKRKALWARLQRIYTEELPAIPLYFRAEAYIMPKWLKGIEPTGHQFPSTLWVENWRAEGRP